jgi:PAS domain S-box-containing protein
VSRHGSAASPFIPPQALDVLLNTAMDGFWDIDFVSDEVYCNLKLHQNLGYELPPGHTGRHPAREFMAQYLHEADLQRASELRSQCEAAHDPVIEIELRALSASGAYRWIRLNGRIIAWTPDGKAARALGWQMEATSGSRLEDSLSAVASAISAVSGLEFFQALVLELSRTLGSRYCYVAELQPGGGAQALTVAAADGGRIEPNFEYALAGSPCEQVALADVCVYPEHVREAFPSDELLVKMNVESYFGVALISSTGTPMGILVVMHEAPMPHSHLTECVITIFAARAAAELERMRTEQSRLTSERRFRELLERINIAAVILGPEGEVQFCNQHLAAILGIPPGEIVGASWLERFVPAEQRDRVATTVAEAADWDHRPRKGVSEIMTVSGAHRTMEWQITNLTTPEGGFAGVAAIGVDLTDKLILEQQVREALKLEAVGRLAGGVAHDFNNLLTVIGGYCKLALSQLTLNSPLAHYLEEIERASDRAADLTRQLLAFSRKQLLQPRLFSLNEVLFSLEPALRRLAGAQVTLRIDAHASTDTVLADPQQIEQVVFNLSINARDAMPRGGSLHLQTANVVLPESEPDAVLDPGTYVVLSVVDSGAGISDEVLAHLFEPFFTTKETGQGTGLGLSSCYGIIRQSGGDIRVTSTPGSGACFRVYLPCTQEKPRPAPSEPASAKEDSAPAAGREKRTARVLVVDDDEPIRLFLRSVLENHGCSVAEAAEGRTAMSMLQEERFDAMVTDLVMPDQEGIETIRAARKDFPKLPIVAISGAFQGQFLKMAERLGADAVLQKPIRPEDLVRTLDTVLKKF